MLGKMEDSERTTFFARRLQTSLFTSLQEENVEDKEHDLGVEF